MQLASSPAIRFSKKYVSNQYFIYFKPFYIHTTEGTRVGPNYKYICTTKRYFSLPPDETDLTKVVVIYIHPKRNPFPKLLLLVAYDDGIVQ